MLGFVARRLLYLVPVLVAVSLLTFLIASLLPGDLAYVILGDQATPEKVAALRHDMGLDQPIWWRYLVLARPRAAGRFRPIVPHRADRAAGGGRTAAGVARTDAARRDHRRLPIGVPLAIACAVRSGGAFDRFMTGSAFGMLSVPTFLSAILLIYLFAVELRWLPATGYVPFAEDPVGNLRFLVLPALTLALAEWPGIMRVLRSDMIATLQEDYIAMARAKGLKASRILFVHALKPSSLTLVTITGINIGRLIGGALIVETIFALPGIGRLLVGAIFTRDLIILQGVVLLVAGGLRADEFHRRPALRRPRSQDSSWPRLNSASTRRSPSVRSARTRRLGPLFWVAIGWMMFVFAVAALAPTCCRCPARPTWTCWSAGRRCRCSTGSAPTASGATNCRG